MISKIRQETGTGVARNPITLLVEAADDIVYATVDIEDGIKKKLLTWPHLYEELKRRCTSNALEPIVTEAKQKIDPAGFVGGSYDEAMSVAFRTFAIRQMVIGVGQTFCDKDKYESIMNGSYMQEILYDSPAGELAKACKEIAAEFVYSSPVVLKREVMGRQVIHDLLDLYWEAVKLTPQQARNEFGERVFRLISPNYRHIFKKNMEDPNRTIPEEYFRLQLITDQIAGMTDTFAVSLHRELING